MSALEEGAGGLRRDLGLAASLAIVVNAVLGTGVFLKMPGVLCAAGSPRLALAAWAVAGLLALGGAMIYAELAAAMPRAGGEYVFLCTAFGPLWGFLYGWMRFFIGNSGGQAALVLGFAAFLDALTGGAFDAVFFRVSPFGFDYAFGAQQLVALAVLGSATAVNCLSVAANGRLSAALAVVKLGLALALGAGTLALARGDWSHLSGEAPALDCGGAAAGAAGFGAAVVGALWAYNGWYSLTLLAGEVRDPGRTIPRALIGGMGAVLAVSMLVGAATLYALAPAEVASVPSGGSAAVQAARAYLGPTGVSVVLAGLLASAFGALQVALMGNARVGYAMAREGLFFESSAKLSPRTRVPVSALLAQAQWTSVLVVTSSMDTLTDTLIFSSWVFYGLAAAGLIVLRRRRPDLERPYRVWGYPVVPAVFVCAAAAIVVNTLLLSTSRSLLGLGLIALGAPAYWYWSRRGRRK